MEEGWGKKQHATGGNELKAEDVQLDGLALAAAQTDDDSDENDYDPHDFRYRANSCITIISGSMGSGVNPHENQPRKCKIPLIEAVKKRDAKKAEKLLKKGEDVNVESDGKSALCYAVETESTKMVETLLKFGPRVRRSMNRDVRNACPFHRAAMLGNIPILKAMLERGVNVNLKERDLGTALHAAASRDRLDVVKFLVDNGAGINLLQRDKTSALTLATCSGNTPICEYLISQRADVNLADIEGWTPLHNASCFNYVELIEILAESGANINQLSDNNESPVFAAVVADRADAVRKLFELGADLNLQNKEGYTPLFEAVSRQNIMSAWTLLDLGVDFNSEVNREALSDSIDGMGLHEKMDLRMGYRLLLEVGCKIRAEWLMRMGRTVLVHRCLSLNRLYKHLTCTRSLGELCMITIRASIKKPISDHIHETGLPPKLVERICLREYIKNYRQGVKWRWSGGHFG